MDRISNALSFVRWITQLENEKKNCEGDHEGCKLKQIIITNIGHTKKGIQEHSLRKLVMQINPKKPVSKIESEFDENNN